MNLTPRQEGIKFLKAFIIILLGIIVFDQLIGRCLKHFYFKQQSGLLYRSTYSIDSTTAKYIVVGSSRANHDYDPKVFETELKSSFYNCGRDKQGLIYSCAVVSGIINRYHPQHLIIDIRPDEFSQSDAGTLSTILPYADNVAISPYFQYNSTFEQVKMLSKIYPFNSLLTNLISGRNKEKAVDYNGFVVLTNTEENRPIETAIEKNTVDSAKLNAFNNLLMKLEVDKVPVSLINC